MAQEGRQAESSSTSSRSLHWAPLHSWNLFSGRVRSQRPPETPSTQLPRSRSLQNCNEGGRVDSTVTRGSGHIRSSEVAQKGGDVARRNRNQRVLEGGSQRHGGTSSTDEPFARHSSQSTSRRRAFQDRQADASDDWSLIRASRTSAHIAHHQQHHHHDHHHHHHHYHYHHLHHQQARRLNEHQPSIIDPLSLNAAFKARDRLDERLRGAAIMSHRHSNAAPGGGIWDDFSVLFDDEEDTWSDDEMWELGIQDWLAAWGYGEGLQANMLSSTERLPMNTGLSKSVIRNLLKEAYVPRVCRRDKESEDTSLELDDCSVCLERFVAGQLIIHLPCKHMFHPDCLTPWLESHGQCPYCRAKVVNDAMVEAKSRATASVMSSSNEDD